MGFLGIFFKNKMMKHILVYVLAYLLRLPEDLLFRLLARNIVPVVSHSRKT